MSPPIEDLLNKVDSKFSLVTLAARRARQLNAYKSSFGSKMGAVVPNQLDSLPGNTLSDAFEEVAQGLVVPIREEITLQDDIIGDDGDSMDELDFEEASLLLSPAVRELDDTLDID